MGNPLLVCRKLHFAHYRSLLFGLGKRRGPGGSLSGYPGGCALRSATFCVFRKFIAERKAFEQIQDVKYVRPYSTSHSDADHFFISTPIFYVNSVPHLGHLYTAVLADAVARWQRLKGREVTFSTGTDEHGLKIQQAASLRGETPQDLADRVSEQFKRLFSEADIQYTDYVRTTEPRHVQAVTAFWNTLREKGHIYKGSYEGWYSTSDEAFVTEDQITEVKDAAGGMTRICTESGQPVEWVTEDNYMFRLSEFTEPLLHWLDQKVICPTNFESEVRQMVASGLPDLSVSRQRERLSWGIQVPGDDSQTIYVWLDALVNYLTASGYPGNTTAWPAHCHLVGKDILKFHAVYWPSFLIAAGIPPPKKVVCHSHWLCDGLKMSKSRGNVVDPFDRLDRFSTDGLRYFLLKEGVLHNDGNYTDRKVVECLNSELCNTLGNLLQRCASAAVNPRQVFPPFDDALFRQHAEPSDLQMWRRLSELPAEVDGHYGEYNVYRALDAIMTQLRQTNGFLQHHKPWEVCKDPDLLPWLQTMLHVAMATLRTCAVLLQPVVPTLSCQVLDRLGVPLGMRDWRSLQSAPCVETEVNLGSNAGPLFPRIKS